LKRIGGIYEKTADWASFAVADGRVVTGQNPASSTAAELLAALKAAQPLRARRLVGNNSYDDTKPNG